MIKPYKYIQGIECPVCEERIWSRHRHDYRFCECGYSSVDGGRDYLRYGFGLQPPPGEEFSMEKHYLYMQEFNEYMGIPKVVRIRIKRNDSNK